MSAASPIHITLPDGKTLEFKKGVTGAEIAAAIGPGLAKAALILEVDGAEWDLFRPIERDAKIRIITRKDPEALELIRHDAAHVLAMAVQDALSRHAGDHRPGDRGRLLLRLRARRALHARRSAQDRRARCARSSRRPCQRAAKCGRATRRSRISKDIGETYKAELIESIPAGEDVSIYWHGDWHDLCRGPHFRTTAKIGDAFKLTKIAGAYWRGDAKNAQLQRIYGTAWRDKKELDGYLHRLEESGKARPSQASAASSSFSPSRPMSAPACRCGCPTAW